MRKTRFAFLYRKDIELLQKPTFERSPGDAYCYIPFDSARRDREMSVWICVYVYVYVHISTINLLTSVSRRWLNRFGHTYAHLKGNIGPLITFVGHLADSVVRLEDRQRMFCGLENRVVCLEDHRRKKQDLW